MSAQTTFIGGLVAAPDLRYTSSGKAVASFTLAYTPRKLDKNTKEWVDAGEPLYMRCNLWEQAAENLAESGLDKGDRLIVTGRLKSRTWDDREGNKRTSIELDVDEIGVTLRGATVKVTKASRGGGSGASHTQDDPWGSTPQGGSFNSARDDEPPF